MIKCFAQYVISLRESQTNNEGELKSVYIIVRFVRRSNKWVPKTSSACIQVLIARRQYCKSLYFKLVVNNASHAPRGRSFNIEIERFLLQQMKKAGEKLYATTENGNGDLSKLGLAKLDNLCSSDMATREQKETISAENVDHLFSSEYARLIFKKFVKFYRTEEDERSISYLIRPDAFTTDLDDILPKAIEVTESVLQKEVPELSIGDFHIAVKTDAKKRRLTAVSAKYHKSLLSG